MTHDTHLVTDSWADYELLDSGDGAKLERFGEVVLARPETQALWARERPELWRGAHATFTSGEKGGSWEMQKPLPDPWIVPAWELRLRAKLSSFKHTGIFPEQANNWHFVRMRSEKLAAPRVLNLFGYTGAASIAAAIGGAKVTHVDASKQSLDWAHENATLSGLADDAVRWIAEDALAFAKREARREASYDGIILDPPAFGRGTKGEVWHIEEDLLALLDACASLLAKTPGAFFLMNGYAAGYASRSFAQAVESAFGGLPDAAVAESGELQIKETGSDRIVPSGIYARFVR